MPDDPRVKHCKDTCIEEALDCILLARKIAREQADSGAEPDAIKKELTERVRKCLVVLDDCWIKCEGN